jgi:hypothetical protein
MTTKPTAFPVASSWGAETCADNHKAVGIKTPVNHWPCCGRLESPPGSAGSKKTSLVLGVLALLGLSMVTTAEAADTGWFQVGVRVWYVGGTSAEPGTPSSNAQEADLIDRVEGGAVHVIQQQGSDHWKTPLPATDWVNLQPAEEGLFWISPARLKAITPGVGTGLIKWLGRERVIYAKTTYTLDTLPFLALLPETVLFLLSPTRQIVTLRNKADDPPEGDYFFDVETGLLLSRTEYLDDTTKTMLTLSELNYDFATRQAFAEDDGPHSAYAGHYSATRAGFLDNQGFDLYVPVISRYANALLLTFNGNLMNVTLNQYYSFSYQMLYDRNTQTAAIRPVSNPSLQSLGRASSMSASNADWQTNGTHLFCWIPPVDLQKDSLRVWNLDLSRQAGAGGGTTFATTTMPAEPAFTSLTFDAAGFLTDLTLVAPAMGLSIDSTRAAERNVTVDGRAYYGTQMKRAVPSGSGLVLLGERPSLRILPQPARQLDEQGAGFVLSGETNRYYVTEYSPNLVSWTPLATNYLSGAEATVGDPGATNAPVRFYRARWSP